jgi:CRP/FNR family nitrogen fixation transcriptional regulator
MLTQTAVAGTPNGDRPFNVTRKSETAEGVQLGVALGFERNTEIYAEGEDSGYVYKIVSGVVRECKLLADGRRQITAFHMPGEMFGLETDEIHHTSAEAVVPAKIIAYRWEGVFGTERQPANFVRELLSQTVSRMFAELKDMGTIKLESSRRVHILDVAKLRAMSALT